ncbi:MAG: nitroreductase family protein [Deltaproteobacteria bacterium]|jgi:nitroreductase|nr:nitroreductase family protein [Deltaproteobacteria bacterium]
MKVLRNISLFLVAFSFTASLALADIKLPPPTTEGGMGVFEALKKRSSALSSDFNGTELSLEELSTVLWAASGLNREPKGWTVPMAMGAAPYCEIYVAGTLGIWLYDWKDHSLKEIGKEDVKAKVAKQGFVSQASYVLIVVANGEALKSFSDPTAQIGFANVLAGAMTQDVYLAAASLGLKARYMVGMNVPAIQEVLKLPANDTPICIMPLGK